MEYEQIGNYYVLMAEPVTDRPRERMVRLPPKRGNIKRQIFAAVVASILASPNALKKMGTALAKIIPSSCNTCCPEKIYPTTSGIDLIRER